MSRRPFLFLDVDGVINCPATGIAATHQTPWGIGVWLPPEIPARVRRLTRMFEPVWATAFWRAREGLSPALGVGGDWPELSWLTAKLEPILKFAQDRPWAFVDDSINTELKALGRPLPEQPAHLLVDVNSRIGLTDEHVEQLEAFAASL